MSTRENKHKRCKIPSLACQPVEAHEHIIQQKQKCLNRCYPSPPAPRNEYVSSIMSYQQRWPTKEELQGETQLWRISRPSKDMSCTRACSTEPCCLVYPIRVLSSTCFLFFHPLTDASSGVRLYGGDITCSSLPIFIHSTDKLLLSRKYQEWARSATLPY